MESKKLTVTKDFIEDLQSSDQVQLVYQDQVFKMTDNHKNSGDQAVSLRLFFWPSLLAILIFVLAYKQTGQSALPLSGRLSIASLIIIIGVLSGFLTAMIAFIYEKRRGRQNLETIYWRNAPTIIVSLTLLVVMTLLFVFYLLDLLFAGLVLDIYLSSLLAIFFFAAINYVMIRFIFVLSPPLMTKLLVGLILGGVFISMVTNREAQWWQDNLSFLGTEDAANAWQFNLTLILSALLMIALVDYLFVNLSVYYPKHRGLTILRILLTFTAIALGLVGYFPADGAGSAPEYHNKAAGYLVIFVVIMIAGIRWLLPKISKEFQWISYGIGAVLVVLTYLFLNGTYMTLTAFEIIAFLFAFSWLMLLLETLEQLMDQSQATYQLLLESES